MVKKHLKQLAAPKSWPLKRKGATFVTRPKPGAHDVVNGIPLALALTNLLNVAKTTKEARSILFNEEVLVDQHRRKSSRFIVGFMDSISFPKIKKHFRILMSKKGVLTAIDTDDKHAVLKPFRINGKKTLGKDKVQINLSFGRNVTVKKDDYKVGDSLLLEMPSQKIAKHIKLEAGAKVLTTSKKHMGLLGEVVEVQEKGILIKSGDETFLAKKDTVFVVGKEKPEVKVEL